MRLAFETSHVTVYQGDALTVLHGLADRSVDCCVTSPPYWGLRDYGVAGQLGLEPTPALYVQKMVEVFREVRRVLSDRGTLWLNLGDSYASNGPTGHGGWDGNNKNPDGTPRLNRQAGDKWSRTSTAVGGLKPKDMVGIPWRVAFALQADGWYLRSDIIWAKPNPMPESVTDRPTKAHEYVFLLSKSERYFFDQDAVRETMVQEPHAPGNKTDNGRLTASMGHLEEPDRIWGNPAGRNIRSVWTLSLIHI